MRVIALSVLLTVIWCVPVYLLGYNIGWAAALEHELHASDFYHKLRLED